jgi:hypothetical protein
LLPEAAEVLHMVAGAVLVDLEPEQDLRLSLDQHILSP